MVEIFSPRPPLSSHRGSRRVGGWRSILLGKRLPPRPPLSSHPYSSVRMRSRVRVTLRLNSFILEDPVEIPCSASDLPRRRAVGSVDPLPASFSALMPLGPIQCARDTREQRVVAMAEGGGGLKLEQTQMWIIAFICSVIVAISFERILHLLGKALKKKKQKALFEKR